MISPGNIKCCYVDFNPDQMIDKLRQALIFKVSAAVWFKRSVKIAHREIQIVSQVNRKF